MTTQYTTILKLALPVQGELSGTWGDVVNNNITQMVEEAVAGKAVINSWTANAHTLTSADGTASESRCAILDLTDTGTTLSGAGSVVCPAQTKLYIVENNTAQIVTVKTPSGSGVAVPVNKMMLVYCDGTNVVEGVTHTNSLSLGTSTTTASSILDEDNMASNSATALSTQQAIKAYVDAQVGTVDTLAEILANGNTTGGTDIATTTDDKVQFRDAAIYINSSVDGQLDIVADTEVQIAATTVDINGAVALNGAMTGGTDITISGELDAATLDISGNADIDGITNLDVVDIDGATQIDATVTVGVDDTGYDVKFFGDTASAYMLWDASADDLILGGAAGLTVGGDVDVDGTIEFDGLSGTGAVTVTDILDEDDLVSDSATKLATQQSIKAYVDSGGSTNALAVVLTAGNTTGGTDMLASTDDKVQFRDAAIYINSSVDGQLDIVADVEIQIAATTIDMDGSLDVDGGTLKVDASNNRVGILNASPDVTLDIGTATDAVHMPVGTTAQRPGSPAAGYFRYNTTTEGFEGYTDAWGEIGGGGANLTTNNYTGNGSTAAFTLSLDPSVEQNTFVYIDGVYQFKNTYSTSGTTLTFSTPPPNLALIEVMSMTATTSIVGTVSDNAITTAKIADGAVTTAKIADDAVTTAKIADDAVVAAAIADDAVVTAAIADDAVTAAKIADDAVVTAAIADDAVVAAAIADDAVVQAAIADASVDEARLQISNAGSNGEYLQKQSGNTGGLTWAEVASGLTLVAVQTTSFTAVAGNQYLCNTTGGAFNMTLPAGTAGDTIGIIDYLGTFDTNNLTLVQSGSEKIFRVDASGTVDTKNWSTSIKYMDATVGWLPAGD